MHEASLGSVCCAKVGYRELKFGIFEQPSHFTKSWRALNLPSKFPVLIFERAFSSKKKININCSSAHILYMLSIYIYIF
jgi:hypothetical protein